MPNKIFKMSEFEQKDMFCIEHNFLLINRKNRFCTIGHGSATLPVLIVKI